jgi:multiple sugar transport system permease protein
MAPRVRRNRIDLYPYLLISPLMLILTVIIVVPIFHAGYTSFFRYTVGEEMQYVGTTNYIRMLTDSTFWNSVWRTLAFTVVSLGLQYFVGLGFAMLLARRFPFQRLWLSLLVSPAAISPVVAAVIWRYMLGFDGVVNFALSRIAIEPIRWLSDPTFAFISVVVVMVWRFYPMIMLILYASLISMPGELFDAAEVDGATGWQRFKAITYPLLLPATLVAVSFRLILTFREFSTPWLMTQGGPAGATNFLSIHMYRQAFIYWNSGAGSAIAWGIMLITLVLSVGYLRLMYQKMFAQ